MADTPRPVAPAAYSVAADYAALAPRASEVLDCWFGAPGSPDHGTERKFWFKRNDAVDTMLRERFGELIDAALAGQLDAWQATPLGALALVIVLDQFSRNCHRGTARAFAADRKALHTAQRMIASGADRLLPDAQHRAFAYLPFEHAESPSAQQESLRLFKQLAAEPGGEGYYRFALRHAKVIERFGRFPHRNVLLGRASSDEEVAFLREPGSSF
jgi:uncharacterized protein (DUF924 family)